MTKTSVMVSLGPSSYVLSLVTVPPLLLYPSPSPPPPPHFSPPSSSGSLLLLSLLSFYCCQGSFFVISRQTKFSLTLFISEFKCLMSWMNMCEVVLGILQGDLLTR